MLSLRSARENPGALKGRLRLWAAYCYASVFLFGSCDTLLTRRYAQKASVTGVISALEQHHGRHPYSKLDVMDSAGTRVQLRIDYAGTGLQVGEKVWTEWMAYNAQVTRMDVLSGSHPVSHLQHVVPFETVIGLFLGTYILFLANRGFRRNPHGFGMQSDVRPPLNGVDTASLLNLNGR